LSVSCPTLEDRSKRGALLAESLAPLTLSPQINADKEFMQVRFLNM
jgi:hypothetical protein